MSDLFDKAVAFLKDPRIQSAPLSRRVGFMKGKGMSLDDVQRAFSVAGVQVDSAEVSKVYNDSAAATTTAPPPPAPGGYAQPPGYMPQYIPPPPPPPPPPPQRDWRDYFIGATAVVGIGAMAARWVSQNYDIRVARAGDLPKRRPAAASPPPRTQHLPIEDDTAAPTPSPSELRDQNREHELRERLDEIRREHDQQLRDERAGHAREIKQLRDANGMAIEALREELNAMKLKRHCDEAKPSEPAATNTAKQQPPCSDAVRGITDALGRRMQKSDTIDTVVQLVRKVAGPLDWSEVERCFLQSHPEVRGGDLRLALAGELSTEEVRCLQDAVGTTQSIVARGTAPASSATPAAQPPPSQIKPSSPLPVTESNTTSAPSATTPSLASAPQPKSPPTIPASAAAAATSGNEPPVEEQKDKAGAANSTDVPKESNTDGKRAAESANTADATGSADNATKTDASTPATQTPIQGAPAAVAPAATAGAGVSTTAATRPPLKPWERGASGTNTTQTLPLKPWQRPGATSSGSGLGTIVGTQGVEGGSGLPAWAQNTAPRPRPVPEWERAAQQVSGEASGTP